MQWKRNAGNSGVTTQETRHNGIVAVEEEISGVALMEKWSKCPGPSPE
jgi:hypothetical protein